MLRKNQPPTAAAHGSSPVAEGETATLNGTNSTDPENGALTFRWSQRSGPDVVLSDASAAVCTFTAPDTDDPDGVSLIFRLTVTDAGGLAAAAGVNVTVSAANNYDTRTPPVTPGDSGENFNPGGGGSGSSSGCWVQTLSSAMR